jgi:nitrite reductase/ring-hydroxylating ferredoxin subunit
MELFVASAAEINEGQKRIVPHGRHEIGVIRAKGALYAYLNICPHQGGPVCAGMLIHRVEEVLAEDKTYLGMRFNENDLHIVCPWHGWEFNVETGKCAGDGKHGLRKFDVIERDGAIYVVV